MSSRYEGRHRGSSNGRRIPQSFRSGFVLPTAAAATLVVTATGATVAQSAPVHLDLTGQAAKTKSANAAFERAEATQQRQQSELQLAAAGPGRGSRASRDQSRQALEAKKGRRRQEGRRAKKKALAAAEAARKATEKWVMPIAGATFTSGYGMRWGRMHLGDDFATPSGRRSRRCRPAP